MNKHIISFLILVSVSLSSQTAPTAKPATKKPGTAATSAAPTAIIDTAAGKLTCTLFPDKAPEGVKNFVGLARGTKDWTNPATGRKMHGIPLYNGTIFHRVIPDFMIQGGDPMGNGQGDPGYKFKNETSPDLTFDRPGRLAYANAGPDTNGSQFFITEGPTPHLDDRHSVFGTTTVGVEIVRKIARVKTGARDKPVEDVVLQRVEVFRSASAPDA